MSQVLINPILPSEKNHRIYRLTVQKVDDYGFPIKGAIIIENPITIEFSVNKNLFSEVNTLDAEIYNLAPDTYNQLFFDYFNLEHRVVVLQAGYSTTGMSTIFIGDMWSCYTRREGANVITKMHCIVGLKALKKNSEVTLNGISRDKVLAQVSKDMDLDLEIYSGVDEKFTRPVTLMGNSMAIAEQYSGHNVYIDDNKLIVLDIADGIKGQVPLINDESGLLGVPKHEQALLTVDIIFEPRMIVGQIIEISSRIHPMFNGQYKVYGIKHEGVISDAEAGKATTTLEMLVGSQIYGRFGIVTPRHTEKSA